MGGSGGAPSGSGGISGSGGFSGTGNAPGTDCTTAADCPEPNCINCARPTCVNGHCVFTPPGSGGLTGSGGTGSGGANDGGPETAAPLCPTSLPSSGPTCADLQGCRAGTTCFFCAPTAGIITGCGTPSTCAWGSQTLAQNPTNCPRSAPKSGDQCGSSSRCYYCDASGLIEADCTFAADTYTWSVGLMNSK